MADYFEYVIIDWDTASFIGIRRGNEYQYMIEEEYDLLQIMLNHDVPFSEKGEEL